MSKYNERDHCQVSIWKAKLHVHLTLAAPKFLTTFPGREGSNSPGHSDTVKASSAITKKRSGRAYITYVCPILFLATTDGALLLVGRYHAKSIYNGPGDGNVAWVALVAKLRGVYNADRVENY